MANRILKREITIICTKAQEHIFIKLMETYGVRLKGLPFKDGLKFGNPSGIGIEFPYYVRENASGTWEFHQHIPTE